MYRGALSDREVQFLVRFTEDDWPQQRIYGDFYREPVEDITRGRILKTTIYDDAGYDLYIYIIYLCMHEVTADRSVAS